MEGKVHQITEEVKRFYEQNPYPGLESSLMMKNAKRLSPFFLKPGKMLYPGCGTGHGMVAMAKIRSDIEIYGMDLSLPSLNIASKLGEKHNVELHLKQGDYMKPLPWPFKFKYMSLEGTLHHAADPNLALLNLVNYLEDDGLIFINLYGKKYHRRRFEIVEMLDILQQGSDDLNQRFALFQALQLKMNQKSLKNILMDLSLRVIWRWLNEKYYKYKLLYKNEADSVPWTAEFKELNQLWLDQFNHPNELTYDIWDTKDLLDSVNLEVVQMFALGKITMKDLPESWYPLFKKLDSWHQYRLMELYYKETTSVGLLAKKKLESSILG